MSNEYNALSSYHFTSINAAFFGNKYSAYGSSCGYSVNICVRMALWMDVFAKLCPAMSSFAVNLFYITKLRKDMKAIIPLKHFLFCWTLWSSHLTSRKRANKLTHLGLQLQKNTPSTRLCGVTHSENILPTNHTPNRAPPPD